MSRAYRGASRIGGGVGGERTFGGRPAKKARTCERCEAGPYQPCVKWTGEGADCTPGGRYKVILKTLHKER